MSALATTTAGQLWAAAVFRVFLLTSPLAIVVVVSLVVGLVMVVLFGYTSDQKAIKVAKDQLKAHLLAVRLFRDQLPVVAGSYAKILRGTGRYLRLAFMPLLYVIIPITLLIVQLDRCLGSTALQTGAPFLVTVRADGAEAMNALALDLPAEIAMTAPAVHVPAENEVVWRLAASRDGNYEIKVAAGGERLRRHCVSRRNWRGFRRCGCGDTLGENVYLGRVGAARGRCGGVDRGQLSGSQYRDCGI